MKKTLGLVTLILLTGVNFITTTSSVAGSSDKVVICHKGKTLLVPDTALQAHLDHGDTRGACVVTECQNR